MKIHNRRWPATIVAAGFFANAFAAEPDVSYQAVGLYADEAKPLLIPSFTNAVNGYLSRYEPTLIERGTDKVWMRAEYEFLYNIDLIIKPGEYEVVVSLAQRTTRLPRARKVAARLCSGEHQHMQKELLRALQVLNNGEAANSASPSPASNAAQSP